MRRHCHFVRIYKNYLCIIGAKLSVLNEESFHLFMTSLCTCNMDAAACVPHNGTQYDHWFCNVHTNIG